MLVDAFNSTDPAKIAFLTKVVSGKLGLPEETLSLLKKAKQIAGGEHPVIEALLAPQSTNAPLFRFDFNQEGKGILDSNPDSEVIRLMEETNQQIQQFIATSELPIAVNNFPDSLLQLTSKMASATDQLKKLKEQANQESGEWREQHKQITEKVTEAANQMNPLEEAQKAAQTRMDEVNGMPEGSATARRNKSAAKGPAQTLLDEANTKLEEAAEVKRNFEAQLKQLEDNKPPKMVQLDENIKQKQEEVDNMQKSPEMGYVSSQIERVTAIFSQLEPQLEEMVNSLQAILNPPQDK
jgi:chromosome segregation ATPase